MTRFSRSDPDDFAAWLDAAETTSPDSSAGDRDDLTAICQTALQIDAMDLAFERQAVANAPQSTPWGQILAATAQSPPPTLGMPNRSLLSGNRKEAFMDHVLSPRLVTGKSGTRSTLTIINRALSIAAVIALVAASVLTAYLQRDRLGFGGGGGNGGGEQIHFAAITQPDGSVVNVTYRVPTAEDCTITPLTVDQMLEKLNAPYYTAEASNAKATAIANAQAGTPQPQTETEPDFTLPEPTYREIAAVQREWLACSLFGSPFQRWSLETDRRVQDEFRQRYMPVIDMALIRQDLEDLAAGNENRLSGPTLTSESLLPMVPTDYVDGIYNVRLSDTRADISVFWVRPDGTPLLNFGETEADVEPFLSASPLEQLLPNAWTFVLNPETGLWQLSGMKYTGG